ncbi:MAG TPA: DUF423 domain-containing protein [Chitinophagaceae bacterium]|nr:DUF423 domain-containing protein [Chitinophagaceae bacterium]
MNSKYITIAAYLGALTVATGAFGAHGLKENLSAEAMSVFDTAVKYQFYHVLALLATGVLYKMYSNKTLAIAAMLFITGIILFCGSLYALTFIINAGDDSLKWVGAITPLGGVSFIAGWLCLAIGVRKI